MDKKLIGRHSRLDTQAIVLMLVICLAWGLSQVAVKVANQSVSPLLQAAIRSAGAAVLLWLWCHWRGERLFAKDGSFWAGLLAGALFAAEFGLIFAGLQFTTASRAVVFQYTAPFTVAVGLHWLAPSEKMRLSQVAGLVLAFGGVIVAFADGLGAAGSRQWIGDAMVLIGAIFWGVTTIVVRTSALSRIAASKALFYQLAVSSILLLAGSLVSGEAGFTNPTAIGIASVVWQTIVIAFGTYLTWFWLIARYPATRLSAFTFLTPLFGILAGASLLGERIAPTLWIAFLLVVAGLWLINTRIRSTARRTS